MKALALLVGSLGLGFAVLQVPLFDGLRLVADQSEMDGNYERIDNMIAAADQRRDKIIQEIERRRRDRASHFRRAADDIVASGGPRIADASLQNAVQLLANYFYFKPLSIQHIYSLRKFLEPMLAEEVVGHLTSEHLRALAENVEATRRPPHSEDERREHRAAELDFHNILASACPNLVLGFTCRFMNDLLKDWVVFNRTYVEAGEQFSQANLNCHDALLQAFQRCDRDAVARMMAEHMEQAACHTIEMNGEIEVKFFPY